ncbi:alpha/beta hydrolase [Akkermansiaceae bacterium]|nr:alpha/beta hydrolase [Akkermansiaceae bacterium]MDB4273185.1 alpha/beta hydrolase [Akkermansiaceae bacterium]MDB4283094.1 alpha/beta hydrolase [Akkermansiaceae bacterium]MDB4667954.1 alpha/beta hydrolase [Akkermansiaceae bacterium]MDB4820322.1 alpha/beta hydrolase [Akkermansiaceae bacterium]
MKLLLALIFLTATTASGQFSEAALKAVEALLGKNGGNRLFYYPTATGPYDPKEYGYEHEEVTFPSEDGTKLHGWFLPAIVKVPTKAKGTVVFSHGNAGAVAYHLGFITWAIKGGYNVLLYDYRAFGKSEGKLDRKGIVEDVRGAFAYVKTRKDVDPKRLISFGHSLGGAKSIAALGEKSVDGVRGIISFAGFSSYQEMALKIGGKLGSQLVTDEYSPRDYVEKISPVPILFIHGEKDGVVPISQARELFKKAQEPKTFIEVKGGNHNESLWKDKNAGVKKLLAWMEKVLNSPQNDKK